MVVDFAPANIQLQPAAQDTSVLRQVFQTIDAASCPHSYNFHMHTVCSDGQLEPEALIEQAIAIGLSGLAITDHHTVNGYRRAQRWLDERQQANDLAIDLVIPQFWTGIEISADLLGAEVHILCYGFNPDHPALLPYLQGTSAIGESYKAESVIQAAHQAGALTVLAHPVRYRVSVEELIPAAVQLGIDGVETYYAYNNPSPWIPSPQQTEQVLSLQLAHNLLGTCGTDTHGKNLMQRL
jgi:predicted metal-dependent phosphoesterase TrpH